MFLLHGHKGRVHRLAFTPDGTLLASATANTQQVWLWSFTARKPRAVLAGHRSRVTCLAVSPDGHLLASSDNAGVVKLWQLPTGREVPLPMSGEFLPGRGSAAFSPDGRILAMSARCAVDGSPGYGVRRWDMREGRELALLPARGMTKPYAAAPSLDFAPDGLTLAVTYGYRASVELWDLRTEQVELLPVAGDGVNPIRYSPDGRTLAGVWGSTVTLWDVATKRPRASWQNDVRLAVSDFAFTPDNRTLLVVGYDRRVKSLDSSTAQERAALELDVGRLYAVAVAPDGMTAAAGGDVDIVVWDVDAG